jgi:catechol 2,3-dioxygenase-like lactoylglutathione lyase family enzyme
MRPAIHIISLAVANLDAAVAFYRDGLKLPTGGIRTGSEDHCLFGLENGLSLVLYKSETARAGGGVIISHLASTREEVIQILQRALAAGATQLGDLLDEPWGTSVNFSDPDHHRWEIIYMPQE